MRWVSVVCGERARKSLLDSPSAAAKQTDAANQIQKDKKNPQTQKENPAHGQHASTGEHELSARTQQAGAATRGSAAYRAHALPKRSMLTVHLVCGARSAHTDLLRYDDGISCTSARAVPKCTCVFRSSVLWVRDAAAIAGGVSAPSGSEMLRSFGVLIDDVNIGLFFIMPDHCSAAPSSLGICQAACTYTLACISAHAQRTSWEQVQGARGPAHGTSVYPLTHSLLADEPLGAC
jgi:hypothetical protein